MCDWLELVIAVERPERPAPATLRSPAEIGTIVRQYQPATADLWRLSDHRDRPQHGAGAKKTPCARLPPGGVGYG
jgi:hypothetical protein